MCTMENMTKLEPVRLVDWAQNSALFARDMELMSETKRTKQSGTESNHKIRLKPIPPSQLHLSFQAPKPSGIGQTPSRPVTSVKKKSWNSSVKVVNKQQRMTETKLSIRKTLTFNSKATNIRKTIIGNETPQLHNKTKVKAQVPGLNNEIILSGIKKIPVTPKNKNIAPKKLPINTPKSILRNKNIKNKSVPTPSRSCDGDASFLRIEREVDDMVKEKEMDMSAELASSTPFKSNNITPQRFPTDTNSLQRDETILDFSNVSENENAVVALCDAFKKALISHSHKKKDAKQERGSLISVIEVALKYIQDLEESEKENSIANNKVSRNPVITSNDFSRMKSPTFKIKKKIVFLKNSPKVQKNNALNDYMGLKKNLNFLNTPKTDKTRKNDTDTPARLKRNLHLQINRLYNDS